LAKNGKKRERKGREIKGGRKRERRENFCKERIEMGIFITSSVLITFII